MAVLGITTRMLFPCGRLSFVMAIHDSAYSDTFIGKGISFSGFEDGNKSDSNDLFQYPGSFNIKFRLDVELDVFLAVVQELRTKRTTVHVVRDSFDLFRGEVYKANITAQENGKVITLKVVNQFYLMKNIDPRTNPYGYVESDLVGINDLILDLLGRVESDYITGIVNKCTYQAQNEYGTWIGVNAWYISYGKYFSSYSNYATVSDVIKSLLSSIGCKGYIGLDRKFYVVPRYYSSSITPKIIKKELEFADCENELLPAMKGVQMFVANGSFGYQEATLGVVEKNGDGSLKYPDLVEVIKHDHPVGELPDMSGSFSGLFLWDGAEMLIAEMNSVRRLTNTGAYYGPYSMWLLTISDAWAMVQKSRKLFKMKISPGYNQDLLTMMNIGDFFVREKVTTAVLHPRWLLYNCADDLIELEAIE